MKKLKIKNLTGLVNRYNEIEKTIGGRMERILIERDTYRRKMEMLQTTIRKLNRR